MTFILEQIKMKNNAVYFLFFFLLSVSCKHLQGDTSWVDTGNENNESSVENIDDEDGMEEIAVFSRCTDYDNNLSAVASDVAFILLDREPPINDFHIYDIQLCDDCVFLADLYQIIQYDRQGKYIRNIGSRGMGPEEYVQLCLPVQLDRKNKLVYASDTRRKRILAYRFDGEFKNAFPVKDSQGCITIIDSTTIALRQVMSERARPDCPLIRFMDYEGRIKKIYPSHLYPYSGEFTNRGPMESYLWENSGRFYCMEFGSDTIYRIAGDSIIPARKLTGKLKLEPYNFFSYQTGDKLNTFSYILRPHSTVFESGSHIIFRLENQRERLFMVYNKKTGTFHRTHHVNAPAFNGRSRGTVKRMDYFIDDLVSGLRFDPQYQSYGKAIALIPATEVAEKREDILRFIASHPSDESARLKASVEKMDEFDNPLMMMVTFK
jgi:hypothetical protein